MARAWRALPAIATVLALSMSVSATLAQPLEPASFSSATEAYEWLLASPSYPPAVEEQDQNAVATIREAPLELLPRLRSDLEKPAAAKPTFPVSYAVFLDLGNPALQHRMAQAAIKTYDLTDRSPISNYLAAYGDTEDMVRIKAEMRADPDGWAVGLALTIVLNNNIAGLALLERLRLELPGAWQVALDGLEMPPVQPPEAVPVISEQEPQAPLIRG